MGSLYSETLMECNLYISLLIVCKICFYQCCFIKYHPVIIIIILLLLLFLLSSMVFLFFVIGVVDSIRGCTAAACWRNACMAQVFTVY